MNGIAKKGWIGLQGITKKIWNMQEAGIILPTILYAVFVQIRNPIFFSSDNMGNLLRQTGFILISGLGMTLVLIAGGIDLSVGSVMGLSCVMVGTFMVNYQLPIWLSIILALIVGGMCGLINGTIIVRFGIPPMIMTLGMNFMARGLVYVVTKGLPVYPLPKAFQAIEQSAVWGVPTIVPICIVLCVVFHILLSKTTFGRSVYAIGGNKEAAKLSGIQTNHSTVWVYVIGGIMAGLTGIMMASRLGSSQPSTGDGNEMNVIAACIVGGTSTFGGRGTILGAAIGAFFLTMLTNSMTLMKVDVYWQKLLLGAVLVVAVILDQYKREASMRGAKVKAAPASSSTDGEG